MADSATQALLTMNTDELAARRTADAICRLLRDFIPDDRFKDAWDRVAKTAYEDGWDLTNKAMRKEYEASRELLRDVMEHSHPPVGMDTGYLRQKHDEVMTKGVTFLGLDKPG
jgi:DNA polymerase III delta subunit